MTAENANPILAEVRSALGEARGTALRSPLPPARIAESPEAELDLLLGEISSLGGTAQRVAEDGLDEALRSLVDKHAVRRAALWPTAGLARLRVEARLRELGVELVAPDAGYHAVAQCDLGVAEVDYALPETGTLGLLSGPDRPRIVSLLPRVHLAILRPAALRADLGTVFAEAKGRGYLVFITGPSRTADIELTLTIGVHGPQALVVLALPGEAGS